VNPLLVSGAKIAGSVVLLALVLWGVSKLSKIAKLDPEIGRKLVHISLGLYCLTFPYVFSEAWEVGATCALAVGVFLLARGTMKQSLGVSLHSVQRTSYGELLFAVSVALLFWLKEGHFISVTQDRAAPAGAVLYILPILILTLCDAASAIVGSRYGRRVFQVEEGKKSIEGVVVFFMTAWLISLIAILLLTDIGRSEAILLAFITAAFGALLEAASWRGLDNLFIPLGLYFLLANLLYLGVPGLAIRAGIFFFALLVIFYMTPRAGADRHIVAVGFTLAFCIAIFSGFDSLLTPAVAAVAYFLCVRVLMEERPKYDALNLLLVFLAMALVFFLASHLGQIDTIFGFNVAFAALAAGIVARFTSNAWAMAGAGFLAAGAMSVRTLWAEGVGEETLVFAGLGIGAIVLTIIAGWSLRERKVKRPWMLLGGLSLALGLISLPASPT
jgi:dolichol kinase